MGVLLCDPELRIWYADDDAQPPAATNPHHARGLFDLLLPLQRQAVIDLCAMSDTTPQIETQVMFGPETDFYQLNARSARALLAKLGR